MSTAKPAALIAAAAVGLIGAGVLGLSSIAATATASEQVGPVCAGTGPINGLQPDQASNAHTIVAIAQARGGQPAAVIAVMVAFTESGLRVLGNPAVAGGTRRGQQGQGTNYDSLGLFQQRGGWGTPAQRMDPTTATNSFLDALLALRGWKSMAPWQAAQAVQRSAFTGRPDASNGWSATVGGNYLKNIGLAARVVTGATGGAAPRDCGGSLLGMGILNAGPFGLPKGFAIPPSASPTGRVAVEVALAQLGKPYVWAAVGPASYDCSGLTQTSWAAAGIHIERTASQQAHNGTATDQAHLVPGDLIATPGSDGSLASPGHIGMYIGDGLVVEAPHPGDVVHVVTYVSFASGGVSAMRHIG